MTSIYLAGKIHKNDWRNSRGVLNSAQQEVLPDWDSLSHQVAGFEVTGPFFVGCDHGCSHIGGNHAVTGGCQNDLQPGQARRWAFDQCLEAIKRADIFFAWLDEDLTAYGTLVEIGHAHALGKLVVIGVPSSTQHPWADGTERFHNPELDNVWFASLCADQIIVAASPEAALDELSRTTAGGRK